LGFVGHKQLLGEEDITHQRREHYSTTVKCVSQIGKLIYMGKEEFKKL
jgi:hypothetical protein